MHLEVHLRGLSAHVPGPLQIVREDPLPQRGHHAHHEADVVHRGERLVQRLALLVEVVHVRARHTVAAVGARGCLRVDRAVVLRLVLALPDVYSAGCREQSAVPRDLRWEAGVEGVCAKRHTALHRGRVRDTEDMVRLLSRQQRQHVAEQREHLVAVPAERAADRVAVEGQPGEVLDRVGSQLPVRAAVHHAVHGLLARVGEVRVQRASHPTVRQLDGARQPLPRHVERRELVERDNDVGTERLLCEHRGLGRQPQDRAVAVRAEAHAPLADREQRARVAAPRRRTSLELRRVVGRLLAEREDLEAARVGDQRRAVGSTHEAVQPARRLDHLHARVHHEVVRVAELQLHAAGGRLGIRHALERGVRADGNEAWRVDDSVRRVDAADARLRAGLARLVQDLEAEARWRGL
mmetsp:Transcript_47540/g.154440  ORF Transcript_47540/g.154440 Transcript_47540/m.154440 type:complete len:409 (+) Transcript_47540:73-1299(+)